MECLCRFGPEIPDRVAESRSESPDNLYGTGMRIGEALSLTLQDVDLENRVLMVRDSKFFKTRLVPIGPRLTTVLTDYLSDRCQLPLSAGEASAFLATRTGIRLNYKRVSKIQLDELPEGSRMQPRPGMPESFRDYLRQRWEAGCRHGRTLFAEIRKLGYIGCYSGLAKFLSPRRQPKAETLSGRPASRIFWKMTALLKPLSGLPAMPTAGRQYPHQMQ